MSCSAISLTGGGYMAKYHTGHLVTEKLAQDSGPAGFQETTNFPFRPVCGG